MHHHAAPLGQERALVVPLILKVSNVRESADMTKPLPAGLVVMGIFSLLWAAASWSCHNVLGPVSPMVNQVVPAEPDLPEGGA